MLRTTVNGQPRDLPDDASLTHLLSELKLRADQVAIEVNRRLVRANRYDEPLNPDDVIEIVTFVGGG